MTQPKLSPRLEELRLAQQAKYAEQRKAFAEREAINANARTGYALTNSYLLAKEEN